MGDIDEQKIAMKDSLCIYGGSFLPISLSEILIKHTVKENSSKGNIWGPFYIPKVEASGGG